MTHTYPSNWLPEWIDAAKRNSHAFGVHAYMDLLGCLKRAHLHEQEDGDVDSSADADFGTNVHAALDAFYDKRPMPALNAEPPPRSCSEAALVDRYTRRFPPLGERLMGERRLFGTLEIDGRTYPIGGTLDDVSRYSVADVCELERTRGILIEPGIYLGDFKTKKQKNSTMAAELLNSSQATLYTELIKQNFPAFEAELKGTLFHILFRYVKESDEQFQTIKVDLADETDILKLKGLVRDATVRLERYGKEHMTPTRCFDFYRQCPAYDLCPRYNG